MKELVCISHLRWDFVWQRPQHLLSRFARQYRVIFVEEPVASITETAPRLDVVTHTLPNGSQVTVIRLIQPVKQERWIGHGDSLTQATYAALLRAYLHDHSVHAPALWLYTPMAAEFAEVIDHSLLVVDVMDQLSAFKGAPKTLQHNETALLPAADVVFTGGYSLYMDKKQFNTNTHLFPSGVEIEHFARAAHREAFDAPAPLNQINTPIIGYFGVIDERMDIDLLATVANRRPDWNIVLIGPVVKIDPADLPQAPNLHYLGMRSYAELPAYLAHFDVATIPFALNDATRFLSPTKTLEYMAARKPIISTPIYDVIELYSDVVRIAATPEAFADQIEAALREPASARRAREDVLLRKHTWDNIAERMNSIMTTTLKQIHRRHLATKSPSSASTKPSSPVPVSARGANLR